MYIKIYVTRDQVRNTILFFIQMSQYLEVNFKYNLPLLQVDICSG